MLEQEPLPPFASSAGRHLGASHSHSRSVEHHPLPATPQSYTPASYHHNTDLRTPHQSFRGFVNNAPDDIFRHSFSPHTPVPFTSHNQFAHTPHPPTTPSAPSHATVTPYISSFRLSPPPSQQPGNTQQPWSPGADESRALPRDDPPPDIINVDSDSEELSPPPAKRAKTTTANETEKENIPLDDSDVEEEPPHVAPGPRYYKQNQKAGQGLQWAMWQCEDVAVAILGEDNDKTYNRYLVDPLGVYKSVPFSSLNIWLPC